MTSVVLRREHLTQSKRFIQVNVSLIGALGGDGNAAIALTAIEWWTEFEGYRHQGAVWWKASIDKLAERTGFTPEKVRRLVEKLERLGVIVREQHFNYDRTYSYRIVLADGDVEPLQTATPPSPDEGPDEVPDASQDVHLADPPDASGGSARTHLADSPDVHVADSPDVPTYREVERERGAAPPAPPNTRRFPDQCTRHQDAVHDDPCGACGRARRRYEAWVSGQERAKREDARVGARCDVDGHEHYLAANCPGCRADRLAAS